MSQEITNKQYMDYVLHPVDIRSIAKQPTRMKIDTDFSNEHTSFGGEFYSCLLGHYITKVIYNNPYTIVFWSDNTKTITKTTGKDKYNPEFGLTLCVMKKLVGTTQVSKLLESWGYDNTDNSKTITIKDLRKLTKK